MSQLSLFDQPAPTDDRYIVHGDDTPHGTLYIIQRKSVSLWWSGTPGLWRKDRPIQIESDERLAVEMQTYLSKE